MIWPVRIASGWSAVRKLMAGSRGTATGIANGIVVAKSLPASNRPGLTPALPLRQLLACTPRGSADSLFFPKASAEVFTISYLFDPVFSLRFGRSLPLHVGRCVATAV